MTRSKSVFSLALMILLLVPSARAQTGAQGTMPEFMEDEMDEEIRLEMEKEAEEKKPRELKPIPPIKMVQIRGGCFNMGDFTGNGDDDERPVHEACVGNYYLQETEVTQELFEAVMGFNSIVTDPDPKKPAGHVSWVWASRFVIALNKRTGGFYRLPTEAEWEFAARERGKNIRWSGTDDETELKDYAWFEDTSDGDIAQVKQKRPNALGLYDMSGNVWEWVEDFFDFEYYQTSPKEDPFGPDMSYWRTIRGGSISESPYKLRTTYRYAYIPALHTRTVGFRLAQ